MIKDQYAESDDLESELEHRKQVYEIKLRNFLIKSNEKWILDQFNLCKRFVLHNSIEGSSKEFLHPVFQHLEEDDEKEKTANPRRLEETKYLEK